MISRFPSPPIYSSVISEKYTLTFIKVDFRPQKYAIYCPNFVSKILFVGSMNCNAPRKHHILQSLTFFSSSLKHLSDLLAHVLSGSLKGRYHNILECLPICCLYGLLYGITSSHAYRIYSLLKHKDGICFESTTDNATS